MGDALFKDWDLDGDLEHLKILLGDAMFEGQLYREKLSHFDSAMSLSRENGTVLAQESFAVSAETRAYVGHYERQVSRIREAIAKRESEHKQAERRNNSVPRLTLSTGGTRGKEGIRKRAR